MCDLEDGGPPEGEMGSGCLLEWNGTMVHMA